MREQQHGSFYRLADRLHIETRRRVIENFLLFHAGDVYQPERLAETERNLRALGFLKSASVTASPPHDGIVDVRKLHAIGRLGGPQYCRTQDVFEMARPRITGPKSARPTDAR